MKEINKIELIRRQNNKSWMDLMRLSVMYAPPKKVKKILDAIVKRDGQVVEEMRKLLTTLE